MRNSIWWIAVFFALLLGCTAESRLGENGNPKGGPESDLISDPSSSDQIKDIPPFKDPKIIEVSKIRKTATSAILNGFSYEGSYRMAQGMAISDSVMYRFFTTGMCKTYDIKNLDKPKEIATFKLGSYMDSNHANSAQFYRDENGERLLYLSGMGGKCYVERITESSSELIQTITLDKIKYLYNSVRVNTICGDDGNLWFFGINQNGQMLIFAKAKRPSLNNREVVIGEQDILDYWDNSDYYYYDSLSQGGKVYEGNMFFVFGSTNTDRHLDVYNVYTHNKVYSFDLNEYIKEEPEDCDVLGDKIIVTVAGGRGYYVLDLVE